MENEIYVVYEYDNDICRDYIVSAEPNLYYAQNKVKQLELLRPDTIGNYKIIKYIREEIV